MQNADRAPNWAYQSALYAARDEESEDFLMLEMQSRKGNVSTYSMQMPNVGKAKDANLGLFQDKSGTNKRGEAEWDHGPS